MTVLIGKRSEYVNAVKLQTYFEDIARGIQNGNTLRTSAQLIKECKDKPYFNKNSIETITKYLRIALCGGIYTDKSGREHEVDP